jgi:DNA polymerase-3 subunit alpha
MKITRTQSEKVMGGSLPDIDLDFESNKREDVKHYLRNKYGEDNVVSVGNIQTYQLRAAVKDVLRVKGIDPKTANYVTATLDPDLKEWEGQSVSDFDLVFINAIEKPFLKKFVIENSEVFNDCKLIAGQPTNQSVHACATLIIPKTNRFGQKSTAFNTVPTRRVGEDGQLVTQWEGTYCESAGFLKEDILGIKQLDKFAQMFELIEKNTGKRLQLEDIILEDPLVLETLSQGYASDCFHFGTDGLKKHLIDMQPENTNDLIAAVALHRPGAIENGSQNDYVKIKNKSKQPHYDWGTDDILQATFGLMIYQEDIMKVIRSVGGFSLVESDDVRRAMGKKKKSLMDSYRQKFIDGAESNGCSNYDANILWNKLEKFAGYGFNKSHAAAYALTGYSSQWMKIHYPTAFWTVAFEHASDEEIVKYSSEIRKLGHDIKISPPDINNSSFDFTTNYQSSTLYWGLTKIRQVGLIAAKAIVEDRKANGHYYAFDEFCLRMRSREVNIRTVVNLVLAGAFDKIENLISKSDRLTLISELYNKEKKPLPALFHTNMIIADYWWTLRQRFICGLGAIDFRRLIYNHKEASYLLPKYIDGVDLLKAEFVGKQVVVSGLISTVKTRNSKNGPFGSVELTNDNETIHLTLWNDCWTKYQDEFSDIEERIVICSGVVQWDNFKKANVIYSNKHSVLFFT